MRCPSPVRLAFLAFLAMSSLLLAVPYPGFAVLQSVAVGEVLSVPSVPTTDPTSMAISPDGNMIVYSADFEGKYRLWLHSIDTGKGRPLPGTEDAAKALPCWSPDSKSVAYFTRNKLRRIDMETGMVRDVTNTVSLVFGCSWNRDGTILFSANATYIQRVSEQGGPVQRATAPDPVTFHSPFFLPDGRHFLVYGVGSGVHVANIGGGATVRLLPSDSAAVYSRSGHLLFMKSGDLYAQPFDPASLTLSGAPVLVAQNVAATTIAAVSTSTNGHMIYRTGSGGNSRYFKWFDREGKELASVGDAVSGFGTAPLSASADGRTVAISRNVGGNTNIWLLEVATGKLTQFTSDPADDGFPVLAPDGQTVYFSSLRTGVMEIYRKQVSDNAKEELLLRQPANRTTRDISRDGRFLLYNGNTGISALQLDANPPTTIPFVPGAYPQYSPDARWVAFQLAQPTGPEIFLQQFPTGRRIQVSTNGGFHVRWRADGKELFYMTRDGKLMAVEVTFADDGSNVQLGTQKALFTPRLPSNLEGAPLGQQYIVSPDGKRFLFATVEPNDSPIQLIKNWQPAQ